MGWPVSIGTLSPSAVRLRRKSLDKLMDIPERRDELEDMLALWAGIGMGKLVHGDSSAEGSDSEDINIIL
ncbi:hypothetical protein C8R48DRAFT_775112 [Suillus tomentosus]|nr:hypothetical protein C8R48DRAFT_775112 [Suillus tomentosus]